MCCRAVRRRGGGGGGVGGGGQQEGRIARSLTALLPAGARVVGGLDGDGAGRRGARRVVAVVRDLLLRHDPVDLCGHGRSQVSGSGVSGSEVTGGRLWRC